MLVYKRQPGVRVESVHFYHCLEVSHVIHVLGHVSSKNLTTNQHIVKPSHFIRMTNNIINKTLRFSNFTFSRLRVQASKALILRGAVRRYTETSGTREDISRSGSFPTSVLRTESRTSAWFATALPTALLRRCCHELTYHGIIRCLNVKLKSRWFCIKDVSLQFFYFPMIAFTNM